MKIVEFRIPIPLKVNEYQRCSIHLMIEGSIKEMQGGSGLEVFRNEKFKSNDRIGYYTEKRYHLAKNLPGWLQSILGSRLTILTEKSWNLYPKLFTKYFNEVFPAAEFSLQTDNIESLTISENVLNLNLQDLNKRQVMFVDLTKFSKLKNYDSKYDLTKNKVGNFLPLKNDWYKSSESTGMVSYKLLRLNLPFFGMLSSKIESYIVNFLYESLIYYNCMGLCSYDQWNTMTMEKLRVTEVECYEKLNEAFRSNYSKMIEKNLKLAPAPVDTTSQIQIPKEIDAPSTVAPMAAPVSSGSVSSKDIAPAQKVKEVDEKKEATTERASAPTLRSDATFKTLPTGAEFAETAVVLNEPGTDVTPTNIELAGPVPMPSFDESEFMDAVENLEDLAEYDKDDKAVRVLADQVPSKMKVSAQGDAYVITRSRVSSVDEATQTSLDSDASAELTADKKMVTVEVMDAKTGAKSTTEKIISTVDGAAKASAARPAKPDKAEKDSLAYDIPITFTGYLYKLGRGFSCWSWNLRYIIVCGFNLYYFDRKNDMRPKDTINLKNSRISWTGQHMNRPYVFSVTTEEKEVYYWSADEEESVKRWILLLQVLCEESPPYIVKQLAYELTYHQNNADALANSVKM